jgi:hypothetical protein
MTVFLWIPVPFWQIPVDSGHSCRNVWGTEKYCKSSGYLLVEPSAEFHHNGFGVSISGVIYQVMELVQVVIHHSFALEVG